MLSLLLKALGIYLEAKLYGELFVFLSLVWFVWQERNARSF